MIDLGPVGGHCGGDWRSWLRRMPLQRRVAYLTTVAVALAVAATSAGTSRSGSRSTARWTPNW